MKTCKIFMLAVFSSIFLLSCEETDEDLEPEEVIVEMDVFYYKEFSLQTYGGENPKAFNINANETLKYDPDPESKRLYMMSDQGTLSMHVPQETLGNVDADRLTQKYADNMFEIDKGLEIYIIDNVKQDTVQKLIATEGAIITLSYQIGDKRPKEQAEKDLKTVLINGALTPLRQYGND